MAEKGGNGFSQAKGDGGKGGKGGKPPKGGKTGTTKPPSDYVIEQELPKNSKCLMDCEAAEILESIQDHMVVLSSDPSIKLPISFDSALTYAKRGGYQTNSTAVRQILERLKKYGVSNSEICIIANVGVESVDEILALIPTLKDKKGNIREHLESVLNELPRPKSSE